MTEKADHYKSLNALPDAPEPAYLRTLRPDDVQSPADPDKEAAFFREREQEQKPEEVYVQFSPQTQKVKIREHLLTVNMAENPTKGWRWSTSGECFVETVFTARNTENGLILCRDLLSGDSRQMRANLLHHWNRHVSFARVPGTPALSPEETRTLDKDGKERRVQAAVERHVGGVSGALLSTLPGGSTASHELPGKHSHAAETPRQPIALQLDGNNYLPVQPVRLLYIGYSEPVEVELVRLVLRGVTLDATIRLPNPEREKSEVPLRELKGKDGDVVLEVPRQTGSGYYLTFAKNAV